MDSPKGCSSTHTGWPLVVMRSQPLQPDPCSKLIKMYTPHTQKRWDTDKITHLNYTAYKTEILVKTDHINLPLFTFQGWPLNTVLELQVYKLMSYVFHRWI